MHVPTACVPAQANLRNEPSPAPMMHAKTFPA